MQRKIYSQISQEIEGQPKKRYSKVGYEVRRKLIEKVCDDGMQINSAAKLLKVKISTAKAIINKYKESGQIFQSRKAREHRFAKKIQGEKIKQEEKIKQVEKSEKTIEIIKKSPKTLISTSDLLNCWMRHFFTCMYFKFPYGNQNLF